MSEEVIASAVAGHAWVGAVRRAPSGALIVQPSADAVFLGRRPWALVSEYIENWTDLYEWAFRAADLDDAADADLAGLTSTARQLPDTDIREWLDHTVAMVLESWPRRLLELGCGTGLLLRHLHGHIGCYVGADVSRYAVDRIRAASLPHTQAVIAGAHGIASQQVKRAMAETMGIGKRPDCVLINGVVQCFPGTEYLAAVLSDAIDLVEVGGRVILGDLRNLSLRKEYFDWLESGAELGAGRFHGEEELFVDPRLIAYLAELSDRCVKVSVRAKTMSGDTEFTRYRYDMVLHVDTKNDQPALDEVCWEDLSGDRLEALSLLVKARPVVVTGIPNAFLDPHSDGVTANELSVVLEGTGLVAAMALESPTRLEVRPAGGDIPRAHNAMLRDEPLERFTARRLPELLQSFLAENFPGARLPEIIVDPLPVW
ncbi:methyltransferase [Amycolatopsis sp. NPDC049868]|uniref:methyltransferase n=1 Tax=Amycolatopsis sp. NPDC049868 TaxID=3363934 RepID=UPI0037AA949E